MRLGTYVYNPLLKARAEINDRSLEGEVRQILRAAVANDMEAKRRAFVVLSEKLRKQIPNRSRTPSEDLIREDRDRDDQS